MRTKLIVLVCLLISVGIFTQLSRHSKFFSHQIQTMEVLKNYEPGRLDGWGNEIRVQSRDERYVLISFGKDDQPDYENYWELRGEVLNRDICGDWKADQIKTESGWIQLCSK